MFIDSTRALARTLEKIFFLGVIFAVLWVKGYLWWVFALALCLYIFSGVTSLNLASALGNAAGAGRTTETEDQGEDEIPVPPRRTRSKWGRMPPP